MPVCRISRSESSGYTFATTVQMYEVFWHIFVANTVAHVRRQATGRSDHVIDSVFRSFHDARLTVTVAAPATWA